MEQIFQKNRGVMLTPKGRDAFVYVPNPDKPDELISGVLVELDLDAGDALVRVGKNRLMQMDVGYGVRNVYCAIPIGDEIEVIMRAF